MLMTLIISIPLITMLACMPIAVFIAVASPFMLIYYIIKAIWR